ncbi:MAG TPA: BON domain-containing protein [Burkholderiales bacterium]
MNMLKRLSAVFIAALLVSALGCATQSEPQSPGAYMGDSWVTTKVKTAILNEPSLKVLQINVETYEGVVQLSGFVDNAASRTKAAEIARSVQGVKTVKNDLAIR